MRWDDRLARPFVCLLLMLAAGLSASLAQAEDTVCARVKIEIKQELTLERQAFDAEMKIDNTTDTGVIENVSVVVKVTDENGTPVTVTDNANDLSAKFFVRVSNQQNISAVDGTGTVNPKTTSIINWLLIPAPGSAGASPFGKKYLVGAKLTYTFGGEETVLDVSPDVITVKPLPLLTLDYFLTQDVWADDPLTPAIEPSEPFTLGVRVKNTGQAVARSLKIDSAQPRIIENNQGLLINFLLTGSYVDDAPAENTLLIHFGDIAPGASRMGRWNMETTLAGKFTEFTAKFSHADELGGALTSILQAANAHFLIHDVRVDLPGRDSVRDFLARDGDVIRVYESDGPDTEVTDRSSVATLTAVSGGTSDKASYRLGFPPTAGFVYVQLPDPFSGQKALGEIVRSDAKAMAAGNIWLSKTRNEQTKHWEYWINFFDVNSTGLYDTEFRAPPAAARPPVLQFIPDRTTAETRQVSFLVEASSPDGKPVTISAAPLPTGAKLTMQAPDPEAPGLARAVFDWTPAQGTAGSYLIVYTASDGTLSATRSASIQVDIDAPPPTPGTPSIVAPLPYTQVASLNPVLSVQTSSAPRDPTTQVQFEAYADEAATRLVAGALVDKAALVPVDGDDVPQPTTWQLPNKLSDNTHYWWRARASDGALYSPWVNGRFFVNLFNDPPDSFNLTNPSVDGDVSSLTPVLAWTNSADQDGDTITYNIAVYSDAALTEVVAQANSLTEDPSGSTQWTVPTELINHSEYFWNVIARDALGAQTPSSARSFVVNTGNTAPSAPVLLSPVVGGQSTDPNTELRIQNSADAENDPVTYVFEIDTVNTFDSSDKRTSSQVIQGGAGNTSWTATDLVENRHYWWRVKARDGRAESAWAVGDFLMNAVNDAPPAPTVKNPGDGAWLATLEPTLEVNSVADPEDEAVRYHFEVYHDAGLTQKVTEGFSTSTAFTVPAPLADKTTYWWRVRALDAQDAASAWSPASVLYVSTVSYQEPSIAVTAPATPVAPDTVTTSTGTRKQVTIRWEGTDLNIEPSVALYYDTNPAGFAGEPIVDGLTQDAGTVSGSHVWDVTNLSPGAYYIYAVIQDAKGMGRAYGAGAVVIPNPTQAGSIVVTAGDNLHTREDGKTAAFTIRLGQAPTATVIVPLSSSNTREGMVSPSSLTFTPENWAVDQTVTVTGQRDCAPDGDQTYQIVSGKVVSVDPDYIGLSGKPVTAVNRDETDAPSTTNDTNFYICGMEIVSKRNVDTHTWEYTLTAELTNTGVAVGGVIARLSQVPSGVYPVDDTLVFGAVSGGETAKTYDTVTLRMKSPIPEKKFERGIGFKWSVAAHP